jgi:hypothetical protein
MDWKKVRRITCCIVQKTCFLFLLCLLGYGVDLKRGVGQESFPFALPLRMSETSAIDLRSLNDAPAGTKGRVVSRDGHFYLEGNGTRIRFWGINVGGPELLVSSKEDISLVAKRLAMSGYNLVRLHHLDNCWDIESGGSLWARNQDKRVIDPERLDKLMFAINEFTKQGIYTNLNTKVSKELTPADGLPAELSTAGDWYGGFPHQKRVDRFSRVFIEHQKQFAKELWTAKNPYSGLRLCDDPAIAFAEINNENSLLCLWPGMPLGQDMEKLPPVFVRELTARWNAWLKSKHRSYLELQNAWEISRMGLGSVLTGDRTPWQHGFPGDTKGSMELIGSSPLPDVRFTVTKASATDWHQQGVVPKIPLSEGKIYTLSFVASGSPPRSFRLSADLASGDYHNVGLDQTIAVKETPQSFAFPFVAKDVGKNDDHRIAFHIGAMTGTLEIRSLVLREGTVQSESMSEEAWNTNAIPINPRFTAAMQRDWIDFLVDVDRAYSVEMRQWFRQIGVKALLTDTQIEWGGVTGFHREQDSDYTDTHVYYGHPDFGSGAWNPVDWTVPRKSWVGEYAKGDGTSLTSLAAHRVAGRPFSVSEYDHPAPNDYRVEMYPITSLAGSLQDWDAIYGFCHGPWQPNHIGKINNFFDNSFDPAKFCFAPSAAVLFRGGQFSPLSNEVTLDLPAKPWSHATTVHNVWKRVKEGKLDPMQERYAVRSFGEVRKTLSEEKPESQSVRVETGPHGPILVAESDHAVLATGYLGGHRFSSRFGQFSFRELEGQFGSLSIVALDGQSLGTSKRLLVTAMGRCENRGMGWNKDRTTVRDQWGIAPTMVVPLIVQWEWKSTESKLTPLNPDGSRRTGRMVREMIELRADDKTVWYEVTR